MRVLHVYKDVYPPIAGGIEKHIDAIRRALPEMTHDVLVCARERKTRTRTHASGSGGREVLVGELGRALGTPLAPGFPRWFRRMSKGAVVHLHAPHPTGEVSCLLALGSAPLVVSYHCDIFRQRALLPAYKLVLLACFARAQAVLVASEAIGQSSPVLRDYRGQTTLVPYGIDTAFFEGTASSAEAVGTLRRGFGETHVVTVGRLVYYKGFNHLVEAAVDLPWPVVIVGDGPERQRLAEQIQRLGLSGRVHLVGSVDDQELRNHLLAASAFVLPSVNRAEAFGISLLEAQAAGLPVVATDVGTGTGEALREGQSGWLVPPGDAGAIRTALTRLLEDPAQRRAMGDAGRRWVREAHSLATLGEALRPVYSGAWATSANGR